MKKVICINESKQDPKLPPVKFGNYYTVIEEMISSFKNDHKIYYVLAEKPKTVIYLSSMFASISDIEETVLIESDEVYA